MISIPFANTYSRLPERFFIRQNPMPVRAPRLVRFNTELAAELGIKPEFESDLPSDEAAHMLAAVFAGNVVPEGAEPLAAVYAGHQFGQWVPRLGDGRAILLGEVIGRDGLRRDIQLKGAGRTPFSRGGDGRAALGPVLREYIVSEAMAALGIPTTRALAAVITGEEVLRERPLAGAILTRVARSHVRIGTFQYFAAQGDPEALKILANYTIQHLYPEAAAASSPVRALLDHVIAAQARLVAQWMAVGFIHGVMNTDNMSIAGETIDFGPCAFMDGFNPAAVFSAIDQMGRYAWGHQPTIAYWNLARFAQAILPMLASTPKEAEESAQQALDAFPALFETAWLNIMRRKIGLDGEVRVAELESPQAIEDHALVHDLLKVMAIPGHDGRGADFTLVFRRLCDISVVSDAARAQAAEERLLELFEDREPMTQWIDRWRQRLAHQVEEDSVRQSRMRAINPAIIPRNHHVERALEAAYAGDFSPFDTMVDALADPFAIDAENTLFAQAPSLDQLVTQTFCGT